MEIFRTVGVEQIVRQRSNEQFVQDGAIMAVETLAGKELAYFVANLNDGIRDGRTTETVRAHYMVAADGAHSRVRERLGIAMRGRGAFSNSVTIYFRANLAPLLRGRNLSVIYVNNSTLRGFFRVEKPFDHGFLAVN